ANQTLSGHSKPKNTRLSTIIVDNLVEKCAETTFYLIMIQTENTGSKCRMPVCANSLYTRKSSPMLMAEAACRSPRGTVCTTSSPVASPSYTSLTIPSIPLPDSFRKGSRDASPLCQVYP